METKPEKLDFWHWRRKLQELKAKMDEISAQITYRKILLVGPLTHRLNEAEQRILDNDILLINLQKQYHDAEAEYHFIENTAHLPAYERLDEGGDIS